MGIVYGSHVFMSLQQTGPFKSDDKGTMLRGVAMAYEGPTYFVTLGDSGIETLEDLEGKKVALGPPGSGTVFNCSNILTALGLLDSIEPQMMTFGDAGRALGNGQIDRSEEHTSELQSIMRSAYADCCLKKKNRHIRISMTP